MITLTAHRFGVATTFRFDTFGEAVRRALSFQEQHEAFPEQIMDGRRLLWRHPMLAPQDAFPDLSEMAETVLLRAAQEQLLRAAE